MKRIQDIAASWQNGPEEASSRLHDLVTHGHRFDARDRAALAWMLLQFDSLMAAAQGPSGWTGCVAREQTT